MNAVPPKRRVKKVVCYVIHESRLLVFRHDSVPIEVSGIQVPAGSIEVGEEPETAAVREVFEETGVEADVVSFLGRELYDITPSRREVADRFFFELAPAQPVDLSARWPGSDAWLGGVHERAPHWTCWWMPLEHAHVLAAGFGAKIGLLFD